MSETRDLLIEIGTEELPPKSLKKLAIAFMENINDALLKNELNFSGINWYATPRRLAVIVKTLETKQQDKKQQRRGPAISAAFDENGKPTKATDGFASSCQVEVEQLQTLETDKGSWLVVDVEIKGENTRTLLTDMIQTALKQLPIAKRMRWGNSEAEFVRPIKWVLVLFGTEKIKTKILEVESGDTSYGHRFHHPQAIAINEPEDYPGQLSDKGKVLVDFVQRKKLIVEQTTKLAEQKNGRALIDNDLLDEVTALVEWPVSFIGEFNPAFLDLPKKVLIACMQDHQKYFPVVGKKNTLLPCFIAVANIESKQPELIKQGNERVIQPRLSDAAFFWQRDLKQGLTNQIGKLQDVVYQKELGTLFDKSERLQQIVTAIAATLECDSKLAKRAAELCLCDLLSEMVFEFPALQGTMGRYYAEAVHEDPAVAIALEEYYQPRFAGDQLPQSKLGQCLAVAERADTLIGIFAIGEAPTGDKDPFALRRTAIGLLRILIECELDIDLMAVLENTAAAFPKKLNATSVINNVYTFLMERLRGYYLENGISADIFEAVLAIHTFSPLDFHQRLQAVAEFRKLPEAESLSAANKRISNILKKSDDISKVELNSALLQEEAERKLAASLTEYQQRLAPMLTQRDYKSALGKLAGLREDIDRFFDDVMVICEDEKIKNNRLALLNNLSSLFLNIADISKLQG